MHLLTAQPGQLDDGTEPIDLNQSPGNIVFLTSADTEIAGLHHAQSSLEENASNIPSLRLTNLLSLSHNYSIDLYVQKTLARAKLIIVRVLGGPSYWRYGLDEALALARANGCKLAVISGSSYPDEALHDFNTIDLNNAEQLWSYLVEGGRENYRNFLHYAHHLIDTQAFARPDPAAPLPKASIYWPGRGDVDKATYKTLSAYDKTKPTIAISFYRALWQGDDLAPVDQLVKELQTKDVNVLPLFAASLKDAQATAIIRQLREDMPINGVINLTAFSLRAGNQDHKSILDDGHVPVFQAILSGSSETQWNESARGLTAKDMAMNIALPEVDGRIITRAISHKDAAISGGQTALNITRHKPNNDRIRFVCELAINWVKLQTTPAAHKKLALILANYPQNDGHIGQAVGLDTPASTVSVLQTLKEAGYDIEQIPIDGTKLIQTLQNFNLTDGNWPRLSLEDYQTHFKTLPLANQDALLERWGKAQDDPSFCKETNQFVIRSLSLGKVTIGVQPGRGQGLDPKLAHHDLTIPPHHGYLAFYLWHRLTFAADALLHMGKHGNLEWLPGKALALSQTCWPELIAGTIPHLYSFVCNDPGEGSQAKRRTHAVILDHLTPPLTRAETYGVLRELETLVDEYYEASNLDLRRLDLLGAKILDLSTRKGLDKDCGIRETDCIDTKLQKLDSYLCTIKELQIRGGLHIYGQAPKGRHKTDLLKALTRLERTSSIIPKGHMALGRALALDLNLGFDPLTCQMHEPWKGERPALLRDLCADPWRTNGDTIERLELLANELIAQHIQAHNSWHQTKAVLKEIHTHIAPLLETSAHDETTHLLAGLEGKFVPPGPSGAPTRGRIDVLPTGRNFYSVDTRTIPTQTAYELGQKSAELLVLDYMQTNGNWPRQMAISAWATANMRTGGDDIAQALALLGVMPTWDKGGGRIDAFEIIPLSRLKRPRVDVLFRMSGFFRDAFPQQIDLLQSAIEAVSLLDEPDDANPIKAAITRDKAKLMAGGMDEKTAFEQASLRLFSSGEGAYGAGLKPLIHSSNWTDRAELGDAYRATSAYGYRSGSSVTYAPEALDAALKRTDAIVQNQDAREFDLLDSEDFYQFEGGLSAAIEQLKGKAAPIYHNDHSNPANPKIRKLEDELGLIIRARATNPKWLEDIQTHGSRGASEIAQTLTNLYGFAALTNLVQDHHFEALFTAYVEDETVRAFMIETNKPAFDEMIDRFHEAIARNLWHPQRNHIFSLLADYAITETMS